MSPPSSQLADSILAWTAPVIALLGIIVSITSLRRKLSAERHFATIVRERNRGNREKIRTLVGALSESEPDESTIREASELLMTHLQNIQGEDRAQLMEGIKQPTLRGRAAYVRKLLELIEREKIQKESGSKMRMARS